jgi:hypothetical protein
MESHKLVKVHKVKYSEDEGEDGPVNGEDSGERQLVHESNEDVTARGVDANKAEGKAVIDREKSTMEQESIDEDSQDGEENNNGLIQFDADSSFCDDSSQDDYIMDDPDDFDVDSYDCQGCGLSFTSRVIFLRHIKVILNFAHFECVKDLSVVAIRNTV